LDASSDESGGEGAPVEGSGGVVVSGAAAPSKGVSSPAAEKPTASGAGGVVPSASQTRAVVARRGEGLLQSPAFVSHLKVCDSCATALAWGRGIGMCLYSFIVVDLTRPFVFVTVACGAEGKGSDGRPSTCWNCGPHCG
jgi:hypothetical protein